MRLTTLDHHTISRQLYICGGLCGTVLRKRKHAARALDNINLAFNAAYNEALHGEKFCTEFKPLPLLTAEQNEMVATLIKEYWCVFDDNGLFIPVRDSECEIDTGNAPPIAVKKINMGRTKPLLCKNASPPLRILATSPK
jgi:hypothetical protein